jgi:hypothetical protein
MRRRGSRGPRIRLRYAEFGASGALISAGVAIAIAQQARAPASGAGHPLLGERRSARATTVAIAFMTKRSFVLARPDR